MTPRPSRRTFIAAGLWLGRSDAPVTGGAYRNATEAFYGTHQGGITTAPQSSTCFAALDLGTERRADVAELLRAWTATAASLTAGRLAGRLTGAGHVEPDSLEAAGLGAARLTVNFGFGPGLFEKGGTDRYGLRSRRPEALADLPGFPGDQLRRARGRRGT
jgi:deferrochelatase/peroxidase EfeB